MIKKQSVGIWFNVITAVLTLISLILYNVNISMGGYYQNASAGNIGMYSVLIIIMILVVVVLAQADLKENVVIEIISGLLRIAIPALITFSFITLISARVEGLGFIFFSNPDVLLEIQTPANMASAHCAIANMVFFGIAAILGMVATFMNLDNKKA